MGWVATTQAIVSTRSSADTAATSAGSGLRLPASGAIDMLIVTAAIRQNTAACKRIRRRGFAATANAVPATTGSG